MKSTNRTLSTPRRAFLKTTVLGVGGLLLPGPSWAGSEPLLAGNEFHLLAAPLLRDWADALLRLQVNEPSQPERHGAFRCPACAALHGRCADAVYPLLHLARSTGQSCYRDAAVRAVAWMKNVDSPDGAWTNDPHNLQSWKGITVFGSIALAESLRLHGDLLDKPTREAWLKRLRQAAQFIQDTFTMEFGNINYPVSASYALALLGRLFDEPRFRKRGREFAHEALRYLSAPNHLLFGEGRPQRQPSPQGLLPIDLGYNVEESLPVLAMYGRLENDQEVLEAVTASLAAHLEFMLPDGAWDNSWGTRSYKWTYWGSRTSDGCQPAYALLADRSPAFATAALRNTQLLRACTHQGLLHGGPHYASHGVPACVHHTFCHAKALATVLDHQPGLLKAEGTAPLPRETAQGVREFTELNTCLVARGPWRGTVTAYDWVYHGNVFHATGGALSLLWHRQLGPLFAASLAKYEMVESNNMQPMTQDFCLTPRLELRSDGQWFSNIYDLSAIITHEVKPDRTDCSVETRLVDVNQKAPATGPIRCQIRYSFSDSRLKISAAAKTNAAAKAMVLVLPLISSTGEAVRRLSETHFEVQKPGGTVVLRANVPLKVLSSERERVFNMVPGFQAVPFAAAPQSARQPIECLISRK